MAKKITMTDIARECGVSQTLVSFVLAGKTDVAGDKTREKILKCAAKHGYKRTGVQGNSRLIGIIIDKEYKELPITDIFFGIESVLSAKGYTVTFCTEHDKLLNSSAIHEGYILITTSEELVMELCRTSPLPFAVLSPRPYSDGTSYGEALADAILKAIRDGIIPAYDELSDIALSKAVVRREAVWLL